MRVDLKKLELIICGTKVEGYADSADIVLPAPRPEGTAVATCEHLDFNDKDLMVKGSVFQGETKTHGSMTFILCQKCVIEIQWFPSGSIEGGLEAQARICPICIDDHSENRMCKYTDLVERIGYLERKTEILAKQRNRELGYNLTSMRMDHMLERAIKKLDEELNEGMRR